MNIKPDSEIIPEEVNLYDYWKILVKRKKIFLGIFLFPLVIVTVISLSLPRYYRGESEITNTLIPAPNIVSLIGNIDDTKKVEIFANNAGAINSVLILPAKSNSNDKINIIIEAKTADIIPRTSKDILDYISNIPEIKGEFERIQTDTDLKTERFIEDIDLKIKKLIEAREANLIFLNQIIDMIKKRKLSFIIINPADLIRKDVDLSLEIKNLEHAKLDAMKEKKSNVKATAGILGLPSIIRHPSNVQIKNIIIFTGILGFFVSIVIVFFLDYIDRMKARKNTGLTSE